jgi:hypothetical protein
MAERCIGTLPPTTSGWGGSPGADGQSEWSSSLARSNGMRVSIANVAIYVWFADVLISEPSKSTANRMMQWKAVTTHRLPGHHYA